MENTFLTQAQTGKNEWWRYMLTILATVAGVVVANLGVQQILPSFKAFFPDNQFGKDLGMSILIGLVFLIALLSFSLAASKLHSRSFFSFISLDSQFNWPLYWKGFLLWGALLFCGGLITDFDIFQDFLANLNLIHFLLLFVAGFIGIGIQSFFEEIVIRGYFLQGLHLRITNLIVLVAVNALIFSILHFGYGIESFIHSFTFGIAFAIVVIFQNRIEFASGAHNANNLLLSLVFIDIADAINVDFSWSIDWFELFLHLVLTVAFVFFAYRFFRK